MVSAVAETVVDGVTVTFDDDGDPDEIAAGLTFAIPPGAETADTAGLTHLVWELALASLGLIRQPDYGSFAGGDVEVDVMVDGTSVEFYPDGSPDEVVAFLGRLCTALSQPPTHLLGVVASGLDPADAVDLDEGCRALLALRYGRSGPGATYWLSPEIYRAYTADEVCAHAQQVFTAATAVLDLDGPLPPGLRLPLPPGSESTADPALPARIGRPAWAAMWRARAGLTVRTSSGASALVAMQVLERRLKSLDQVRTVAVDGGPGMTDWLVVAGGRASAAPDAVATMWRELETLARDEVSTKELDRVVGALVDSMRKITAATEATAEVLDEMVAVRPSDVLTVFRHALPTTLITVPYGERAKLDGVTEVGVATAGYVPDGEVFPSTRFGFKRPEGPRLVLTFDSISRVDETIATVRRSDATLLDASNGRLVLIGPDLATVVVDPDRYAGAESAVQSVAAWFE
jgi:hypothetical protein